MRPCGWVSPARFASRGTPTASSAPRPHRGRVVKPLGDESRRASRLLPLVYRSRGDVPFGLKTSVFKVAGKMFALSQLGADSLRVSLKCEPRLAEALRAAHTAVIPGSTSTSVTGTP